MDRAFAICGEGYVAISGDLSSAAAISGFTFTEIEKCRRPGRMLIEKDWRVRRVGQQERGL